MNLYTERKVYRRLAAKLPAGSPSFADWTRWSVEGDKQGVAAQRAAHCSTYAADPAIARLREFPDAAWDPDQAEVGARYGIVWLTMADLHHNATGDAPIAAVVLVGDVLFFNITLSTTIKHIRREDGPGRRGARVGTAQGQYGVRRGGRPAPRSRPEDGVCGPDGSPRLARLAEEPLRVLLPVARRLPPVLTGDGHPYRCALVRPLVPGLRVRRLAARRLRLERRERKTAPASGVDASGWAVKLGASHEMLDEDGQRDPTADGTVVPPSDAAREGLLADWNRQPTWVTTFTSPDCGADESANGVYQITRANIVLDVSIRASEAEDWVLGASFGSEVRFDTASDALGRPALTFPALPGKQILAFQYRTFDSALIDRNRSRSVDVCKDVWGEYDGDRLNCDEYPFASTQGGAANANGNVSARLVAAADNQEAGRRLNQMYTLNRVLDGEQFEVRITS